MNSKLKLFLIVVVVTTSVSFITCPAQTNPNNIIGKWNFVEMLDQHGRHIDTLRDNDGVMIPNEGNFTFSKDSSYFAQFTEQNLDNGTWTYDYSDKSIILKLYYKKPYDDATNYIISLGFAQKDEKGDYYDLIQKKIIELSPDKMIILGRENRQLIYKKVK